jgi:hypothetical protein
MWTRLYPTVFGPGFDGQTADYSDWPPCSVEELRIRRLVLELLAERCPSAINEIEPT